MCLKNNFLFSPFRRQSFEEIKALRVTESFVEATNGSILETLNVLFLISNLSKEATNVLISYNENKFIL